MLVSEAPKAWAVPWKPVLRLGGTSMSLRAFWTAFTASPRETPGARLKDTVAVGNCPWWFTARGAVRVSTRVKALMGTEPPEALRT